MDPPFGKQVSEEKSQVIWHAAVSEGVEQKGRCHRVLSQNQSGCPPQLRSLIQIWSCLAPKKQDGENQRLQNASPQTYL